MAGTFKHRIARLFLESRHPLNEVIRRLEAGGERVVQRLETADDSPANRDRLRHMIAIERWSQRRLRVLLGESFAVEDSSFYRPPNDLSWDDLKRTFARTRWESVELAKQMKASNLPEHVVVAHDEWGDLTVRGWLNYIRLHAELTSRRLRWSGAGRVK